MPRRGVLRPYSGIAPNSRLLESSRTHDTFASLMYRLAPILAVALTVAGCLDSAGSVVPGDAGSINFDTGIPQVTTDGAVSVPPDSAVPSQATFSTGIGAGGVAAHSEHFKLLTKTGGEPGGSGLHSAGQFKMVGGVSHPAAPTK
jgi:hypothetical protein